MVLIDFWTYTCINCIRTLPYVREWHEKYADHGLVILGVHTPEFAFEREYPNVVEAAGKFELEYPIVQDNEFGDLESVRESLLACQVSHRPQRQDTVQPFR